MNRHDIDPELAQALWEAGKAAAKHLGLGEPEYMTICGGGVSMQEEKTINWRAMTPAQRDQLMIEKVLGYSLELVQDSKAKIPRFSQSLDAAWLLWPKLAEGDDGKAFVRQCKFMCAWTEDDDVEHYDWRTYNAYRPFLEIGDMSNVTAERICIAMLRAFDYEVLTEEAGQ